MSDHTRNFLDSIPPAEPPPELRERVLHASRTAFETPPSDQWTRLWRSRVLRLAWAAAVVALMTANAVVFAPRALRPTQVMVPLSRAAAAACGGEVAEIADLPRIVADVPALTSFNLGPGAAAGPRDPSLRETRS